MNRKLELLQMMLLSLMSGMSEDEKLSFLTDAFCLTEDLRHDISTGGATEEEVQGHSELVVPCGTISDKEGDRGEQERSDEANGEYEVFDGDKVVGVTR